MVVRSFAQPGRGPATPAHRRIPRRSRAGVVASPALRGRGSELLALGRRYRDDHDLVQLKLMVLGGLIVVTALLERII